MELWEEGNKLQIFFNLVSYVCDVRWAPLSREAEWSWPQRMITVSSAMPPLVLRLWLRLTIKGRIMPRDCGWRKLRATRSRRYCRFLWGQSVVWAWLSVERKSWNGSLFISLTLLKFLFSRECSEAGQRRTRKEGNEYKMMPNRRNMYTVQNNSGIQWISTYLSYFLQMVSFIFISSNRNR